MILNLLVKLWKVEDAPSRIRDIDFIVPISYSTTETHLVNATRENLLQAIAYKKCLPNAVIVFSNCSYTFSSAEVVESKFKKEILAQKEVEYVVAESMNNSVEEAERIKERIGTSSHKRILIITGEMHTRSARLIWRKVFPEAGVVICSTSHQVEYQKDHPVNIQRTGWQWFCANIARQILLRMFGLAIKHFHHRATTP